MSTTYTALEHELPTVTATMLITAGNNQVTVTCPHCDQQHRHLGLGLRRSPCGHWYLVRAIGGQR
ncbi:hypothetical protein ACIQWN_06130 [Streptomyces vinaceus]|uniref:hypothetical protein n=1 Tax=Streptomyces vinaceus TaxID=1960 RepID=UPI0037F621BA